MAEQPATYMGGIYSGVFESALKNRHEFLKTIGLINVNYTHLESVLRNAISILINADPTVEQIVTAQLSYQTKATLLSSLFRYRMTDAKELDEFEQLLALLKRAGQERDIIIHSDWGLQDFKTIYRFKTTTRQKKGLSLQREEKTVEDLQTIADLIAEATRDVTLLCLSEYQKRHPNTLVTHEPESEED